MANDEGSLFDRSLEDNNSIGARDTICDKYLVLEENNHYRVELSSPHRSQWSGREGTAAHICELRHLKDLKQRGIFQILDNTNRCT